MPNKSRKTKNHGPKNQKANSETPKDNSEALKSESTLCSENNNESTTCNAVLLTKSKIGDEKDMIEDAKLKLERALRDDDLYFQDMRGESFVGNHGGLNLAELAVDVRAVKDELTTQKKKHLHQEKILKKHEEEISRQKKQLSHLAVSSKEYMQVRNRFISVFKHDKLQIKENSDDKIITDGNIAAHKGDAFADATLYTSLNKRFDRDTFETLYGLNPKLVSSMSKYRVFSSS